MSETRTRRRAASRTALPSATDYLDSLIPAQAGEREIEGLKLVERSRIALRPQARRSFPEAEMRELAASIRSAQEGGQGIAATGIFVPLLVVPAEGCADGSMDGYALVAGERRYRASQPSPEWPGVPELPCLLMRADARGVAVAQLIENLQRQGLPPLEEAAGIRSLMREQGLSIRDVARTLGKDKGYLENRLRLLKMGDDLRAMVSSREDTLKHAYYIDQVTDADLRRRLIQAVLEDRASVAQIRSKIEPRSKIGPQGASRRGASAPAPPATPESPTTSKDPAATEGPERPEPASSQPALTQPALTDPARKFSAQDPTSQPDPRHEVASGSSATLGSATLGSATLGSAALGTEPVETAGAQAENAQAENATSAPPDPIVRYIAPGIALIEQGLTELRGPAHHRAEDGRSGAEAQALLESLQASIQKLSVLLRGN